MFGVTTTTGGTTGTGTTTPSTKAGFFGLEGFSGGADMTMVAPKQTETIKGRRVVFISVDVGGGNGLTLWSGELMLPCNIGLKPNRYRQGLPLVIRVLLSRSCRG